MTTLLGSLLAASLLGNVLLVIALILVPPGWVRRQLGRLRAWLDSAYDVGHGKGCRCDECEAERSDLRAW